MIRYFGTSAAILLNLLLSSGTYGNSPKQSEQENFLETQTGKDLKECRSNRCNCSSLEPNEKNDPSVCGSCVLSCMKEMTQS